MEVFTYRKGERVSKNSLKSCSWEVVTGIVRVVAVLLDGKEVSLGFLSRGQKLPFLEEDIPGYDFVCLEKVVLKSTVLEKSIDYQSLFKMSQQLNYCLNVNPMKLRVLYLFRMLFKLNSSNLSSLGGTEADTTQHRSKSENPSIVWENNVAYFRIPVRITHQQIADSLCSSRVTITRIIRELCNDSSIVQHKRVLYLRKDLIEDFS